MTVAELIAKLQSLPDHSLPVLVDNGDHPSFVDCTAADQITVSKQHGHFREVGSAFDDKNASEEPFNAVAIR